MHSNVHLNKSLDCLSSASIRYYWRYGKSTGIEKFFRHADVNKKYDIKRASSESSVNSIDETITMKKHREIECLQKFLTKDVSTTELKSLSPRLFCNDSEKELHNTNQSNFSEVNQDIYGFSQMVELNENYNKLNQVINKDASNSGPVKLNVDSSSCCTNKKLENDEEDCQEEPLQFQVTDHKPAVRKSASVGNISPTSASTIEHKLEWDSLGDIGYKSKHVTYGSSVGDLDQIESKALGDNVKRKKIFRSTNTNYLSKNAPKREAKSMDRKEVWKETFEKYKDKYNFNHEHEGFLSIAPDVNMPLNLETQLPILMNTASRSVQTSQTCLLDKSVQVEVAKDHDIVDLSSEGNISVDSSFQFLKYSDTSACNQCFEPSTSCISDNSIKTTDHSTHSESLIKRSEDELKMCIAFMNSVLESKSLHIKLKKTIITKIMQKIAGLKHQSRCASLTLLEKDKSDSTQEVSTPSEITSSLKQVTFFSLSRYLRFLIKVRGQFTCLISSNLRTLLF